MFSEEENIRQSRDFIYVKDVVAADAFFALKSQATGALPVCDLPGGLRATIKFFRERPKRH